MLPKNEIPSLPPWEDIVKIMHDKNLTRNAEIIKVIYSKENDRRVVIYRTNHNVIKYDFEQLFPWDEDEWFYYCNDEDALPGFWNLDGCGSSMFSCEEDAVEQIISEPWYGEFFE